MSNVPNPTPPATWEPPTARPKPWWKRDYKRVPVLLIIGLGIAACVVVALGIVLTVVQNHHDTNVAQVPLCDALADPANSKLTAGDWWRIEGMQPLAMIRYVKANCPEYLDRVGG